MEHPDELEEQNSEQVTAGETHDEQPAEPDDDKLLQSGDGDISPLRGLPFPVVGVGASAGGLEAIMQLLRALPPTTGMAFVIVQHLDPHYESQLTELLREATEMPVHTVQDGVAIERNSVFVIPPNADMVMEDGKLRLAERKPGLHLPIDSFFTSLAHAQGSRAVGIVLSGNASDGSQGVRAIKGECGLTFAQDEASARHSGMPRNAAATGAVDFILPPAEIARELIRVSHHSYVMPTQPEVPEEEVLPEGDGELKRVFRALYVKTKVDFSHYKQNTLRRRIGRRMIVSRTPTLTDYADYLDQHPNELQELHRDLLISVTNFFRDADVFSALMRYLRDVLETRPPEQPLRIWVPGCATGEEVYTLAICINELLEELKLATPLQIFGTDISEIALERARAGRYQENIAQDVSPERLQRYFVRADSGYQISKMIRESCVFARQDLASDPPFAHTDVISCRNVLIYMDTTLQKRILPVFHYSLNPTGLLVLGSAESVAPAPDFFNVVDQQHRIYSRKAVPVRLTLNLALDRDEIEGPEYRHPRGTLSRAELQKKIDRVIQTKYSPAAVVVDAELQIIQFRGETSQYLDPVPGDATLNLLRMLREVMVVPLRRALEAAREQKTTVRQTAVHIEFGGEPKDIEIEVTPVDGATPGERYFLIVFEQVSNEPPSVLPVTTTPALDDPKYTAVLAEQCRKLHEQLSETRQYIRNLTEDYEASSEELRASNEEVRSSNEELQSTNEELSTTKEELQSANEELTTVNDELQNRNQELDAVNNDLNNLLGAISIPIVMVDNGARVRRFNLAAEKLLHLSGLDLGRSISHLQGSIVVPGLESLVRKVIETLAFEQREIQDQAGKWYSLSIRPYRTGENRIDGAVILYADIDPLKRSLSAAEEARDYAESMIETVNEPLMVLNADLRILRATRAFYEFFETSRDETIGRFLYDLGNGQWNQPRLRELLGNALFRNQSFQDYELEHDFPHIGRRVIRLNGSRISREGDERRTVLLSVLDVTKRRHEAEVRYQHMFDNANDGILAVDAETGKITDVNRTFLELTGYGREQIVGKVLHETPPFRGSDAGSKLTKTAAANPVALHESTQIVARSGRAIDVEIVATRYAVGGRQVIHVNVRDISARVRAERSIRETEGKLRSFVDSVQDYAFIQLDLEGRITGWNSAAQSMLGYKEEEIVGSPSARFFTPEDVASGIPAKEIEAARSTGRAEGDRWQIRKDGRRFFASGVVTAIRDDNGQVLGFARVMRDTTQSKLLEERLVASVKEKEVLLGEIHHRVKNNLQVIASLLGLQSQHITDPRLGAFLEQMLNRVRSIGMIHEMLYSSHELSKIDICTYLTKIANYLFSFYEAEESRIEMILEIPPVDLPIDKAIPCGLIANELLTNSLRHAFPAERKGKIRIGFSRTKDEYMLLVADDGIGLATDIDPLEARSMGLQLVLLLVEQLNGRMQVQREAGAQFTISFPASPRA